MGDREVPTAAGLRQAANQLRRGEHVDPAVLTDAADELVGLARQLGEVKASLTYTRAAFDALTVVLEEQAETCVAAVELLREAQQHGTCFVGGIATCDWAREVDRVLETIDRPHGQDGQ